METFLIFSFSIFLSTNLWKFFSMRRFSQISYCMNLGQKMIGIKIFSVKSNRHLIHRNELKKTRCSVKLWWRAWADGNKNYSWRNWKIKEIKMREIVQVKLFDAWTQSKQINFEFSIEDSCRYNFQMNISTMNCLQKQGEELFLWFHDE